ncbi:MAG TPA: ABC transporter substrate-binding protein [Actinomycetota bacterium]|nr:ABC transporter substrate-binding protein [Actinomycetota bacterium]
MRMRLLRPLSIALMLALVGTACGDTGTDGRDGGGGTVEIAAVWTAAEQEAFREVLDAFTEETGTQVTYTSTGDQIATVLRTRLEGNDPPDLAVLPQPGLLRDLVSQNAVKPIEEIVGETVDENWAPSWRELGSIDDTLYGLWFKASNKSTVWYNVRAFENAGVEAPETWDDFKRTLTTIRDSGTTPLAIGGGSGWVLTDWFENIYLRTAGPELYDQLVAHEIPWTHDSVKAALRTFGEILQDRNMIARNDPTALEFEASVDAVWRNPPDAAIVFEGDFVPGVASVEAEAETDYDVFDFPSIGGSPAAVVGSGDMVVMLDDNPQARALLEYLATPEAAEIWAAKGGFGTPNQAVDANAYPDPIIRRTATALAEAETFRFDLSDLVPSELGGDLPGSMWGILQEFARDPSTVDQTAERLEARAAQAYG